MANRRSRTMFALASPFLDARCQERATPGEILHRSPGRPEAGPDRLESMGVATGLFRGVRFSGRVVESCRGG
jgi:hypothetical protein